MERREYVKDFRQDLGYALRMLRRSPAFTTVAILTLALGIGANSAIFSVVHGVLLKALPFDDAARLYQVRTLYPDGTPYSLSAPDFMSVRQDNHVFEQVETYSANLFTLLGAGEPLEARGARVSVGLFRMLGLSVAIGREFLPEENQPGRETVAVLDHGFWQRTFGGDPNVLGRRLTMGGESYLVVGVLARGARLPLEVDVYAPLRYDEAFSATTAVRRRSEFLSVLGRAKNDVAIGQIESDLRRVGSSLQGAFPQTNGGLTFTATSVPDLMLGGVRTPLVMLLGAVGFVLLVACANVANLLLARASARQQELAVRSALGAGRGRLLRQLLTEAVVLGLAGGAIGLLIARLGTQALVAARPADIPRLNEVGVNGTVVLFTLLVTLVTSLAFGALPALQATGSQLTSALREGTRGAGSRTGHRVRAALVVAEMALAVVLLMGAGLLIRSFVGLMNVAPGFRPEQAMALRVTMQGSAYQDRQQVRNRVAEFEERIRAVPGVTAVAVTNVLPLSGRGSMLGFRVEGAPPPPANVNQEIAVASVTPEYFQAIGTPMRAGRAFTDSDHDRAPLVALVNEATVRSWFQNQNAIGKFVTVGGQRREIVGVVGDVLQRDPAQPAMPQLFAPYAQRTTPSIRIVIRAAGDPLALAPAIRAQVRALDANLAITEFTPLERLVTGSVARPRFYTSLLALFAGVALVLAATGIFGVMSYAVAQRAHEISIRMALGARAAGVLGTIVGRALALAAGGLAVGIAVALALGRIIQGQLFGVKLLDPLTLTAVVAVLAASAAAASFLPAWRAARLDPSAALRES